MTFCLHSCTLRREQWSFLKLKGKNFLPRGANSFLSEETPFQKEGKNYLTPLKLYPWSLINEEISPLYHDGRQEEVITKYVINPDISGFRYIIGTH